MTGLRNRDSSWPALRNRDSSWPARITASAAALLTVAAGLGIRAAAGGDTAKYAGDALYALLVLTLIAVVAPRVKPLTAAVTAVGISWAIEFFQLSGVPADLSRRSAVARLVLGSTFNAPDLFWYVAGAAFGFLLHRSAGFRRRSPGGPAQGTAAGGTS